MAMEFCRDGFDQSALFSPLLLVLSESQRGSIALNGGARFYPAWRSAARGSSQGSEGRAAWIFVATTKGVGAGCGFCLLQLHFLSLTDVATFLSLGHTPHRSAAFGFIHQPALALCNINGHSHGRLARGQTSPAWPRPVIRPAGNPHRRNDARPGNAGSSVLAKHRYGTGVD